MSTSIDSLKLRFPLHSVEILADELKERFTDVDKETGEIIRVEDYSPKEYLRIENGITTTFQTRCHNSQNTPLGRIVKRTLWIELSAKALQEKYLEGITSGNYLLLLEYINSLGIVNITPNVFINDTRISDIDYKRDFKALHSPYLELIDYLEDNLKSTKSGDGGFETFREPDNTGIRIGIRPVKSPIKSPHCQVYSKCDELKTNSKEFAQFFLKERDYENLRRIEVTVKNLAHLRSITKDKRAINDWKTVLSLCNSDIVWKLLGKRVKLNNKPMQTIQGDELNVNDKNLLTLIINYPTIVDQILKERKKDCSGKVYSNFKKKVRKLEELQTGQSQAEALLLDLSQNTENTHI
ncbi:MAG: hypothetical protein ACEPOW_09320 [Bacteroidales bacterium]